MAVLLLWIILLVMFHVGVCCNVLSVLCSIVVTCLERADLLAVVPVVFVAFPNLFWSTSESKVRLAPSNWSKLSSKIFDRSKAVHILWIIYVFSVLCLLCLCARQFICTLWSPTAKGLALVVSHCKLSLSHWYSGSGVTLDCIDS